jgi:hypothetical protein
MVCHFQKMTCEILSILSASKIAEKVQQGVAAVSFLNDLKIVGGGYSLQS